MTDFFALLHEPRQPWLELEALKSRYMELSAVTHPDRMHEQGEQAKDMATVRSAELNAAWRCLSEPKDRLLHLLQLEAGEKPVGLTVPPSEVMELFSQVGLLCRETDQFLVERSRPTSPMLKVKLFERGLAWTDQLLNLQSLIGSKQKELETSLRSLNEAWAAAPPVHDPTRTARLPLTSLEELYRLSSYLHRWNGQLQERIVHLSM